jgi:signal transduction histidine kinase
MVAGLAHESRNALQQIQASIEMLARRLKSSSENSLILEIQKAHDRIVRLLDEVRSYAGPMKLAREIHDVAPLWQEAWKQLSARRLGREASLHSITNGVDLRCLVDPFPIETVFRNIFENSLANCRDPVRIVVSCSESEREGQSALRIRIQDNGVGPSPEQRSRIFEPFFITRTNGSGLSMAIAKRIVEAHEGTIKIGDEPGTGTTIEIHLPRG